MLKNGLFIMTLGFIILILGVTDFGDGRVPMLIIGVILIAIGFFLYHKAEKRND